MKKIFSFLLLTVFSFSLFSTVSAATEQVSDYTFNEWEMVGIKYTELNETEKADFWLDSQSSFFLVSFALRALDWTSIDMIDANVELDKNSFEIVEPEVNIGEGDIFSNVNSKWYNTENWFLSFVATTDIAYDQVDPNEAFWFIMKVKDDNSNESASIKISPENFMIKSSSDELTNLLTEPLEVFISSLPTVEVDPVIVEEPIEVVVDTVEEPKLEEKVEEIETWVKDIALISLFILFTIAWLLIINKKEA